MAERMMYNVPILQSAQNKYNNYAEQINSLMQEINTLVTGELHEGWVGDSYDSFLAQNDAEVKPAFTKMSEALNIIASQIDTAVRNAIAADEASRV